MTDPETLHLFDDKEQLASFAQTASMTYLAMLQCSAAGGLATGEAPLAVLLSRLVLRMLQYKADRSVELAIEDAALIPILDEEVEKLWPMFQAHLDAELREAREALDRMRAEAGKSVQ